MSFIGRFAKSGIATNGKDLDLFRGHARIRGVTETPDSTPVRVLIKDIDKNVLLCSGTTIPDSEAGFAKGCIFIKTDASDGVHALMENVGTVNSCTFNKVGEITSQEIDLAQGYILVGDASGKATSLNALASANILVGNGTTVVSVAVSGDATIDSSGVLTVGDGKITYAKIQDVSATDKVLGRASAGAGDIEEIPCTAYARSLLDDPDAATARQTLGSIIGTDVEAWDAFLDSIAALGTGADKIIYTTAVDTAAEAALTAFARTLLDDIDAPTARGTLGAAASGANSDITSLSGLTTPLSKAQGGTGNTTGDAATVNGIAASATATANELLALDASAKLPASVTGGADATQANLDSHTSNTSNPHSVTRAQIGAAASGANTDITSLGGLTTPLAASEGGTGIDSSASSGVPKIASGAWTVNATADDVPEGATNLYFNGKTQDDLPDGTTYKQYNPASVAITGGSISGITDLAVADGGTGASDAAGARTNLNAQVASPTLNTLLTHSEVALTDADATLTAAQMESDGIFTITPTAARTLTTDTAANLVAGISSVAVGNWFEFTVVDLAAYDVTLAAGAGVTITGDAVANNSSATFLALFTNVTAGSEAVTIYRK